MTTYDQEGEDTLKAGANMLIAGVEVTALGQLAFLDRPAGTLDTVLDYHGQTDNYRLAAIRHGTAGDALPDYGYTGYDAAGNLTGMTMRTGSTTETFAFGYDELNRLTSGALTNAGTADFSYTYAYSVLGNITARTGTAPALTYQYNDADHKQAVTQADGGGTTYAYTYDARGDLLTRMVNGVTSTYDFDVQGQLTSISGAVTAGFAYDPDGNRVKAVYGNRTVYTTFPDYEVTDNDSNGTLDETRTTYRLAGRIIAVRGAAGNIRHVAFDHLGSVGALFDATGTLVSGSLTRFDPFGNFRGTPPTTNPGTTNNGYTGHRHNNTGPDLGLIYMNARYYLPEVGRFISADTIVPDPQNPQSYNRYGYTNNNPVNYTDPSGHCVFAFPIDTTLCALAFGALTVVAFDAVSPDFNAVLEAGEVLADFAYRVHDNIQYAISNADADDETASNPLQELAGNVAGSPGNLDPNDPDEPTDQIKFTDRQLQKKFDHASDFGVKGNYSKANAAEFRSALQDHISNSSTQRIEGWYRNQQVTHYYDPDTGLNVMVGRSNNQFISGWKLNEEQIWNLLNNAGKLGGC